MLLAYLLSDRLAAGQEPTPALADEVVDEALGITEPAHQAVWQSLGPLERAVLAATADRLVDHGHLIREPRASRLVDPLLAEWIRRR